MRKVYKIEIVCGTRRDILTELKIDQDVQGQRGSYHQHQLGFHHHLGGPGKHFGEHFYKIVAFYVKSVIIPLDCCVTLQS